MFKLVCLMLLTTITVNAQKYGPFHQTLTSAARNIRLETWQVTDRDVPFPSRGPWSIHKYTLHGGKQEGVEIIAVDNGKVRLLIVPTRGMNVLRVESGDLRLGWDSPVKEVVHPSLVNLQSRGGLGWLEGFNEWMVRCGLEWAGHPGKDKFINNTGDEAEMDLTLHGKIGNTPASEVEIIVDPQPPNTLHILGRVDERMFYGPKLEIWTEVMVDPGASSFRIQDSLTNLSAYEQEFELIYHANYGPPLLEAGARFVGAVKRITPFNAHAAKSTASFAEYVAPTKGFIEQVYMIEPFADAQNQTTVMLHNAAGDKAVFELPFPGKAGVVPDETAKKFPGLDAAFGAAISASLGAEYGVRVPQLATALELCESPIEARFLLGLICSSALHGLTAKVADSDQEAIYVSRGNDWMEMTLWVFPQFEIGDHCLDFALHLVF